MTKKRFQVALSFPGEQRSYVLQVAQLLTDQLGEHSVFYDDWYKHELARPNLDTYLQKIYHQESELLVPFLCADYERKEWCGLEWRAIRDLIKFRQDEDIMPLRFDDTHISGLFSIDGYIDLRSHDPKQISDLIIKRLCSNNLSLTAINNKLKTILPASSTYEDWQAIGKYKIKDGIAVDTKEKLMWLRFAYGEEWTNRTWQNDTGKATQIHSIHLRQLPKIIEQFNTKGGYDGFCDWRLPSINELRTLIEENRSQGQYVNRDVFPESILSYWSSTENPNHYGVANQFIDTYNGEIGRFDTCDCSCSVRLVRSIL